MIRLFVVLMSVLIVHSQKPDPPLSWPARQEKAGLRVSDGTGILMEQAPWQAALFFENQLLGGGSIISQSAVLTAAHLVYNERIDNIMVGVGAEKIEELTRYPVKDIIVHEKYNTPMTFGQDYDVAIVIINGTFPFNEKISSIDIVAPHETPADNELVSVTGWGQHNAYLQERPKTLARLYTNVTNWGRCQDDYWKYGHNVVLSPRMFCAGSPSRGTCRGDDGGALIRNKKKQQLGIVSYSYGCNRIISDVYTDLSHPEINNFITHFLNPPPIGVQPHFPK